MFSGGAVRSESSSASSQGTSNPELETFTNSLDLSQECQASLRALDEESRTRCLTILRTKMMQRGIQQPSSYLSGIIRNELKVGSTFGSSVWHQPAPLQQGPPMAPARTMLQGVASPMQQFQQRGVKRPAWVAEAWMLSNKPTPFLKKMYGVIGQSAMANLSQLSAQTRLSVLLAITYSEGAWSDPTAAVAQAIAGINSLPPLQIVAPPRSGKPGRSIVAIQLGSSYGSEWVHLLKAMEKLKPEFPDLVLHSRHAFLPGAAASDMYAAMFPQTSLHKTAAGFVEVLNQFRAEWRSIDAIVLLMVTLPGQPTSANCPNPIHGYHSGQSCNFWKIIEVLKAFQHLQDNRWAMACLDPKPLFDVAPDLLKVCFGDAWDVSQQKTRVPARPWRFRSWLPIAEQDFQVHRSEATPGEEGWAPGLRSSRAGLKDVFMPMMEELEEYNDATAFSDGSAPPSNTYELFEVKQQKPDVPGSAATRLLNRSELASLWGVGGWGIDEAFSRVHPCCVRCDSITGFASDKGMSGVACGAARYCIHCEAWYKMLIDSAPAHAHSLIHNVLHQSLLMPGPSGSQPGWASVESHSCDEAGCSGC